jgi:hypothetical protein
VGPRAGLDAVVKRKIPVPYRESNPCRPRHSIVAIPTEMMMMMMTTTMMMMMMMMIIIIIIIIIIIM